MASCNPTDLLVAGKCFDCLSPGLKETAKLQLLCEIANGGGGGSGITSLTGDVTATGPGAAAATIAAGAVTLAKMANIATNTVIGRSTAGTGAPEALTSITPASAAFSGTAGAGFVSLLTQSSVPAAPATGFALYADSSGKLSWRRATDGFTRSFDVTATANRTFTLPDASFTFAGQNLANTFSLAQVFSANGALSAPAVSFTGTPITGGTSTTTKPLVLIETAGATSTGWATGGTMLGVNALSGFAGRLQEWQVNGTSQVYLTAAGSAVLAGVINLSSSGGQYQIASDTFLSRKAAANWQLGAADAASPVAQTLSVQSVVAGTSNTAGANTLVKASASTGNATGGSYSIQVTPAGSSGTAQNAFVTALTIAGSGAITMPINGALSAPAVSFTGTPIAGGTATTTKPMVLVETAGATSTGWSTSGTLFGVNSNGGSLILFDFQSNGSSRLLLSSGGNLVQASAGALQWLSRGILTSPAAGQIQLGNADAASPVAQKLSRQSVVAGTSNTAGALFIDVASLGTGTGDSGSMTRRTGIKGSSGTVQHVEGTRDFLSGKDTVLTESTATKLFTVPIAAGGFVGMKIVATVYAADATDFQTLTSELIVTAVAKSTTITKNLTQIDGTVSASSGTLTPVTFTAVDDGSNVLSIKCDATSSLTQTTLICKWMITSLNSNVSATITPL